MLDRERRSFRRAARRALKEGIRKGTVTRFERGKLLLAMNNDDTADEMMDVCLAQCVECKIIDGDMVEEHDGNWVGIGENIDWKKLADFIITVILPMFI